MARKSTETLKWSPWSEQGQAEIKKRRKRWAIGAGIAVAGFAIGAASVYFKKLQFSFAEASEIPTAQQPRVTVPVSPTQTMG